LEHQEHDWNRQREQLSALLDDELTEHERAALEAHLSTCAQCRAELTSLRRARALVRALPQPTLPRTFALPLATTPAQETPQQALPAARPAASPERRSSSASPARLTTRRRQMRTLQWISTIAAVLGIVLLLPGAFSSLALRGETTANSAYSNQAPVTSGQGSAALPSPTRTEMTHPSSDTPAPTAAEPSATPGKNIAGGQPLNGTTSSPGGSSSWSLLSTTNLGLLLLVLSACGFAFIWRWHRLNR
jgi:anti-sigma factor RsiW